MICTLSVMDRGGGYTYPEPQHGANGMSPATAMLYQQSQSESETLSPAGNLWTHYPYSPAHCLPHASLTSPSQPFFNNPVQSSVFQDSASQSYSSSFLASNYLDFQEPSLTNDFSNHSLLSSSPDSLSDIRDTHDFLTIEGLDRVPTLWDSNTAHQGLSNSQLFLNTSLPSLETFEDLAAIINTSSTQERLPQEEEEEDEDTEELGHTETYADYVPSKSKIGRQHPDRVVETSTLSSVPPPDISYSLALPLQIIAQGLLSALQLEAIVYACQQHEVILPSGQRAGFLIGDGAGVGKGRTVSGIILENFKKGRKKALWFSVSNDLRCDAERDLRDINAGCIAVHALNKIKYGDTSSSEGVLFATYSALIGESQAGGQHRTRIKQIRDWCGENFDGVVSFLLDM